MMMKKIEEKNMNFKVAGEKRRHYIKKSFFFLFFFQKYRTNLKFHSPFFSSIEIAYTHRERKIGEVRFNEALNFIIMFFKLFPGNFIKKKKKKRPHRGILCMRDVGIKKKRYKGKGKNEKKELREFYRFQSILMTFLFYFIIQLKILSENNVNTIL